jgi:glycosyltransferase involved in cell wall biosynthesis
MAAGAAVLASSVGGTAESIVDGVSGVLCDFRSRADCLAAVARLSGLVPGDARRRSRLFGAERFSANFLNWIAPAVGCTDRPPRPPVRAAPTVEVPAPITVATR